MVHGTGDIKHLTRIIQLYDASMRAVKFPFHSLGEIYVISGTLNKLYLFHPPSTPATFT